MSTQVCCHQSNANMSPQSGVQRKDLIQVSSSQTGEMQPLEESKTVLHQDKGEAAYTEKVPDLVPIGPSLCKWWIQICTVWLVHIALSWLVELCSWWVVTELLWLVDKDACEDLAVQLQLNRTSLSPLVEIWFQEVLYKGGLSRQEHRAGAFLLSLQLFPEVPCWRKASLSNSCWTVAMEFEPS